MRKLNLLIIFLIMMLPTLCYGATGDIYDLETNMKYTPSNSQHTNLLKQQLKSRIVKEQNLYIEDASGKLYNYKELRDLNINSILTILTNHNVDISNPDSIINGIISNTSEIFNAQDINYQNVLKYEKPEITITPTISPQVFSKVDYYVIKTKTLTLITINNFKLLNAETYIGPFYLTVRSKGNTVYSKLKCKTGEVITIPTTEISVLEINQTSYDKNTLTLDLQNLKNVPIIDVESSRFNIDLVELSENIMLFKPDVEVNTVKNGTISKYSNELEIQIMDKSLGNPVYTTTSFEILTIQALKIAKPYLRLVDKRTGIPIYSKESEISTIRYSYTDGLKSYINISNGIIYLTFDSANYWYPKVYVKVIKDDNLFYESVVNVHNISEIPIFSDNYTLEIYSDKTQKVLLHRADINTVSESSIVVEEIDTSSVITFEEIER